MCAFVGASAALSISEIPFLGPIGAVRIGRIDGDWAINPVPEDLEESDLELIVAGNEKSIVMVEGGAQQLPEDEVLAALKHAHGEIQPIIAAISELQAKIGKEKLVMPEPEDKSALEKRIEEMAGEKLSEAFQIKEKKKRNDAVKAAEKEVKDQILEEFRNEAFEPKTLADFEARQGELKKLQSNVGNILHDFGGELMRERVMATGERIDGRASDEIRPIAVEVRPFPRPHGVALFTRGETQAVVSATLGSGFDEQTIDGMGGRWKKQFMLHYNFPPFFLSERRGLFEGLADERSAMERSPSAPSRRFSLITRSSRTRFVSCPRPSSRTVRRRWRRSAVRPSRCSTPVCRSRRRSRASRWV